VKGRKGLKDVAKMLMRWLCSIAEVYSRRFDDKQEAKSSLVRTRSTLLP
jgi:hypothetical protein